MSIAIQISKELPKQYTKLIPFFSNTTKEEWRDDSYCYFTDKTNWRHDYCVVFQHSVFGFVVVDVLKDSVIGGVEFVDRL